MKIMIIRHADPDYEHDSLTPTGWKEARLLAEQMKKTDITASYVSPLGRAKDTAKTALEPLGITSEVKEWLMEFPGYVIKENGERGIPWDLYPSFWTVDNRFYGKDEWLETEIMKSGNVKEMYEKAIAGLDELLASHGYVRDGNIYRVERENTDTIALFCHFGIECVLLSHLLGVSPVVLWQGFVALPSSVTLLVSEEREQGKAYFRCNRFGDVSHLLNAGVEPSFAARFCETFSNKDERH